MKTADLFKEWDKRINRVERHLYHYAEKNNAQKEKERLYVNQSSGARSIVLSAGSHPVSYPSVSYDIHGTPVIKHMSIEKGASLVISQADIGLVVVLLYPYKSEKVSQVEKYIIYSVLKSPKGLSERFLESALTNFEMYMNSTSALRHPSFIERRKIGFLKFRSQKYQNDWSWLRLLWNKLSRPWQLIVAAMSFLACLITLYSGIKPFILGS